MDFRGDTKKNMLNKYKYQLGILLLTIFSTQILHAQLKDKAAFTEALNQAFKQKELNILQPYLSENFSIAGHTGAGAQFRLTQIIKSYPAESVQIRSEQKVPKGILYTLEFKEKEDKQTESQALVDPDGKLIYITQFDHLYGMQRLPQSKLVAQIPFENHNGSIILTVQINSFDRPLRLLFDTGADGMAVSQTLADEIGLKVTRENNASVVGGSQTIKVSDNNTIKLDTLTMKGMGIAIFPEMGRSHAEGIIGNSLVRRYITHIDYDNNILSLYEFGKHQYEGKGQIVPVTMPSGIMVLPGQLDITPGKSYPGHFVFDTGASYDLICFRPFVRQNKLLVSGFKSEVQSSTVSMGISSPTFLGQSHQFAISPLPAMQGLPITLMGGSPNNESWDPGADGSIGVRLLSRYNMTINLAEGEVYFNPSKLHALPQDFILNGYQFGWDNSGELKVLGAVGFGEGKSELKEGDQIQSIAGYTKEKLQKKSSLIDEIKEKVKQSNEVQIMLIDNTLINL